ncbi:sulfite reductase subunit beta, partial [Neisseria sp. P0014.S004]
NGCGRAILGVIGLVGIGVGLYNLYAGCIRVGTRMTRLFKEKITEPEILEIVEGWVADWSRNRLDDEGFGDFAIRTGIVKPVLDAPRDFWA